MKTIISMLMVLMSVQVYSQWESTMSLDGEPGSNAPVDVTLTETEVVLSGLDEACASLPAVFHIPLENGFSDGFDIEISKDEMGQTIIDCLCCDGMRVLIVVINDWGVEYFEINWCEAGNSGTGKYWPMG